MALRRVGGSIKQQRTVLRGVRPRTRQCSAGEVGLAGGGNEGNVLRCVELSQGQQLAEDGQCLRPRDVIEGRTCESGSSCMYMLIGSTTTAESGSHCLACGGLR